MVKINPSSILEEGDELKVKKKPVQRVSMCPNVLVWDAAKFCPKGKCCESCARLKGYEDPTGKLAGRGAYLHDRRECWGAA